MSEIAALEWVEARELVAGGFVRRRPETDYGTTWADDERVRVSFAPAAVGDSGFLYAYDRVADRYAVLCPDASREQVDLAWELIKTGPLRPDGYLAFVPIVAGDRPLPVEQARNLVVHCVDHEARARRDYAMTSPGYETRLQVAHAVVIAQSVRGAAEELQVDAVRAQVGSEAEPVIVRWREPSQPGWTGRVAAASVADAAAAIRDVQEIMSQHGFGLQPTSVSHGRTVIAAARVAELDFAGTRCAASAETYARIGL